MGDKEAINDRQTAVSMTVLMTPDMANFSGNVHGGGSLKIRVLSSTRRDGISP